MALELALRQRQSGTQLVVRACEHDRERDGGNRGAPRPRRGVAMQRPAAHQHAEDEHQLPCERIEAPAKRFGVEELRREPRRAAPHQHAAEHQPPRLRARERHDRGRREREQHVHRQHRSEIRLPLERQQLDEHGERRREQHADVVERHVRRIDAVVIEHGRHDEHQRGRREKRAVDLRGAAHEAPPRGARAVARADGEKRARRREAAEEHEHLRRVAQRERVQRHARQHARADVIDDDRQQHEAAEEIDLDRAPRGRRRRHRIDAHRAAGSMRAARAGRPTGDGALSTPKRSAAAGCDCRRNARRCVGMKEQRPCDVKT
ncbi:hypothetical protein DM52_4761 [Burkholderia mallei]|nr:hypothetical protein DM52_4761 [Burkholderia mallei]